MATTKGVTTKDDEIDKGTKPVTPVPTQNKADDIREDAVVADGEDTAKAAAKAKKDADAATTGPSPTQAELDEIREHAVGGKRRDLKAEDARGYKTR